jgi:hypothetical protein
MSRGTTEIVQIMPSGGWKAARWWTRDDGTLYAEIEPLIGWALLREVNRARARDEEDEVITTTSGLLTTTMGVGADWVCTAEDTDAQFLMYVTPDGPTPEEQGFIDAALQDERTHQEALARIRQAQERPSDG